MLENDLACALRERLIQKKLITKKIAFSVSDWKIIESYIICSCCGKRQVDNNELFNIVKQSANIEHFFNLLDNYPLKKDKPDYTRNLEIPCS